MSKRFLLTAIVGLLLLTGTTEAAAIKVSFTFPRTTQSNVGAKVSYRARGSKQKLRLVLQRYVAGVRFDERVVSKPGLVQNRPIDVSYGSWRTLRALKHTTGTATLPRLAPGRYIIRIAALDQRGIARAEMRRRYLVSDSHSKRRRSRPQSLHALTGVPLVPPWLSVLPAGCRPRADFRVGIQDDGVFLYQHGLTRAAGFAEASRLLGASLLRLNVVYGDWIRHGALPYVEAATDAHAHGYKVELTLTGTPSYMPLLDQALSYQNPDPHRMYSFAREVAVQVPADQMQVWNEPNYPDYLADGDIATYVALFTEGKRGLLDAGFRGKILTGGPVLLGYNGPEWVKALDALPSDGVAVHPYASIDRTADLTAYLTHPLYEDEYGNRADQLDQATLNQRGLDEAYCDGAADLVFYQLLRSPAGSRWDTGLL